MAFYKPVEKLVNIQIEANVASDDWKGEPV